MNTFSKSNTISCPTIWGNYSSGYIASMQLNGQIGVVLIKIGWEWPSIWSFYSPSSLSKNDSVILAALILKKFYIFFCDDFFLIQVDVKEYFLTGSVRKREFFAVKLQKYSVVFSGLGLEFIMLGLNFIFVSDDKMIALLSVPVPINIWNENKLGCFRVINGIPFLDEGFLVVIRLLHIALKRT